MTNADLAAEVRALRTELQFVRQMIASVFDVLLTDEQRQAALASIGFYEVDDA